MKPVRLLLLFLLVTLLGGAQISFSSQHTSQALAAPSRARVDPPYIPSTADQIRDALRLKYRSAQLPGTPTTSHEAQAHTAAWTVMIYMAADNDLEAFAMGDINEMEFIGSTTDMNIVVQLDRSPNYNSSNGNWTDTRRLFINRDTSLTQINSEEVSNLGETNTGDPATLVDFAGWAIKTYPAQHYALILWDHGGSWYGVASDETSNFDDLSLPELTQAMQQVVTQAGLDKLDAIGFDACLMGSLEVYQAIAPYARYGIGSAELIPGNGWDYFGAFDALAQDPSMDGQAFGKTVVDSFMTFYETVVTSYTIYSLGLVDLAQADGVVAGLQSFTDAVNAQPDAAVDVIGSARKNTTVFGAFDDPQFTDVWAATDFVQFMQLVSGESASQELHDAAAAAQTAGENMMLYYQSSEALQGSGGLSIYFPRNSTYFYENNRGELYTQEVPSALSLWPQFLGEFYNLVAQLSVFNEQNDVLGVSTDGSQAVVNVQTVKNSLVDSSFLVLLDIGRGQQIIVDYSQIDDSTSDTTGLNKTSIYAKQGKPGQDIVWAATVPYLSDGTAQLPVLILHNGYNPNIGIINGVVYLQDGPPINAQLVVDLTTSQVTSVWGIRSVNGTPMPSEIMVQPGDLFQPTWFTLGQDGTVSAVPTPIKLVFSDNPLFLVWKSAPGGAYSFVTLSQSVSGETNQDEFNAVVTENSDQLVVVEIDPNDPDIDKDGVLNEDDNCPVIANPGQEDADGDQIGDVCDLFDNRDIDQDGVLDENDNCPTVANPDQLDTDEDGIGDICQSVQTQDQDQDGIVDDADNCLTVPNPDQLDTNGDGRGNACDIQASAAPSVDSDEDGITDDQDNCPNTPNADQVDLDRDGIGDACDPIIDSDQDGVADSQDNCPYDINSDQADADHDGFGDACDGHFDATATSNPVLTATPVPTTAPLDSDGDGYADTVDNCPSVYNPDQADSDSNGIGDACDVPATGVPTDSDGDGYSDWVDNCPSVYNPDQKDSDGNGIGDACDAPPPPPDADGDGYADTIDNCPSIYNPDQADSNSNGIGDACEALPPPVYDIALSISAPATAMSGSSISYTITVSNVGNQIVSGIQVSHTISPDLFSPTYSVSQGTYDGIATDWLWDIGALNPGGSASLGVDGMVSSMDVAITASLFSASADYNSSNDSASQTVMVTVPPPPPGDVSVSISAPPSATVGNLVSYTITVTNLGASSMDVSIAHSYPGSFSPNTQTPSAGTWDGLSGLWTVTVFSGTSETLTIDGAFTIAGPTILQATLSSSTPADTNSGNDLGSATVTVGP